jgi:O-antigen/teichoic acid export membrane protein
LEPVLPIVAVGMLAMLSIPLAVSLGLLQSNAQTLFTAVLAVVMLIVVLTFMALAYDEHEPEKCFFEE